MKITDLTKKQLKAAAMGLGLRIPAKEEVVDALEVFGDKSAEELSAMREKLYADYEAEECTNDQTWLEIEQVEIVLAIKKA